MRLPTPERRFLTRHLYYFNLADSTLKKGERVQDFSYDGKDFAEGKHNFVLGHKVPFATIALYLSGYPDLIAHLGLGVSVINPEPDPKTGKRDIFTRANGAGRAMHRAMNAIFPASAFVETYGTGSLLGHFPAGQEWRLKRAARRVVRALDSFTSRPPLSRPEAMSRLDKLISDALVQEATDRDEMAIPGTEPPATEALQNVWKSSVKLLTPDGEAARHQIQQTFQQIINELKSAGFTVFPLSPVNFFGPDQQGYAEGLSIDDKATKKG